MITLLVYRVVKCPVMKLITVNMEGTRHVDRIVALIEREQPDCICLQEMPAGFIYTLVTLGFYPTFAPMLRDTAVSVREVLGVAVATKIPHHATIHTYSGAQNGIPVYERRLDDSAKSFPVVTATFTHGDDGHEYTIATTHLMVTVDGVGTSEQQTSVSNLLGYMSSLPSHIFAGDFNMPRGYNTNYERFLDIYTDCIPPQYASSLDQNLHRDGGNKDIVTKILSVFMVDYIFSQPPYIVSGVRLEFGVSDHAAVIADIRQTKIDFKDTQKRLRMKLALYFG